jgi:hypothetical protein
MWIGYRHFPFLLFVGQIGFKLNEYKNKIDKEVHHNKFLALFVVLDLHQLAFNWPYCSNGNIWNILPECDPRVIACSCGFGVDPLLVSLLVY